MSHDSRKKGRKLNEKGRMYLYMVLIALLPMTMLAVILLDQYILPHPVVQSTSILSNYYFGEVGSDEIFCAFDHSDTYVVMEALKGKFDAHPKDAVLIVSVADISEPDEYCHLDYVCLECWGKSPCQNQFGASRYLPWKNYPNNCWYVIREGTTAGVQVSGEDMFLSIY